MSTASALGNRARRDWTLGHWTLGHWTLGHWALGDWALGDQARRDRFQGNGRRGRTAATRMDTVAAFASELPQPVCGHARAKSAQPPPRRLVCAAAATFLLRASARMRSASRSAATLGGIRSSLAIVQSSFNACGMRSIFASATFSS